MKEEIINFIHNINIGYVALGILFLIASLLFLNKKKINNIILQMYIILFVSIAWLGFIYLNDIFNSIFALNFLSVKLYLILLIIGNIIMLITINHQISLPYKIANCMFFLTNLLIFIINIIIIISNRYNNFTIGTLEEASKLIDINFIVFISYLILSCSIYIIKYIIDILLKKKNQPILIEEQVNFETGLQEEQTIKVLYPYQKDDREGFYIDGVDCSIIFEDSNEEEIIKNYYILLNDVNAKLTNGYTIKEYKKIKNVINKLNIKDLNNINLDVNKLNMITIDEYNLLKNYLNTKNKSF